MGVGKMCFIVNCPLCETSSSVSGRLIVGLAVFIVALVVVVVVVIVVIVAVAVVVAAATAVDAVFLAQTAVVAA